MAFQQTLNRKTRQQKIRASSRQTAKREASLTNNDSSPAKEASQASSAPIAGDYDYIAHDLKKIGWITLVCLLILAIATVFISDFQVFIDLRESLNLPTL